jgi:hypothetical protein
MLHMKFTACPRTLIVSPRLSRWRLLLIKVLGRENPSDGFGDNENAFDSGRHVKIGVEATLAGVSYDIGQSIVLKAHVTSLESFPCYFLKGFAQLPSAEFVPYPWENEVVVFEDFFAAGLRIPPYPILLDILCKF